MEDGQIIQLYWQRSETAIAHTAEKYGSYCYAIAQSILSNREDSEECVNDTYLRAWNAMPPQRPGKLRIFLGKITRNLAFDKYKARTAQKRGGGEMEAVLEELSGCIPSGSTPEEQFIFRELEQVMAAFVRKLPRREGDVFVRRYFFAEAVKDIAGRYSMSENHVSVSLSRTRQKLKACLQKEGYTL